MTKKQLEEDNKRAWVSNLKRIVKKFTKDIEKAVGRFSLPRKHTPFVNREGAIVFPVDCPPGYRNQLIQKLFEEGYKAVIDRSAPGSGKSHSIADMENSGGQIFYVAADHRNPTTAPIEANFTDVAPRHDGLYHDNSRHTPLGEPFIVWNNVENKEEPDIRANCHRAALFNELNQKGISVDDMKQCDGESDKKVNPICANCRFFRWKTDDPMNEDKKIPLCAAACGDGYGYMFLRSSALAAKRVRLHINSLSSTDTHDYGKDILVLDEASKIVSSTRTVIADYKDFAAQFTDLQQQSPEQFQILKPLHDALFQLFKGDIQRGYYGLDHEEVLAKLPQPPEANSKIIEAIAASQPDFATINETPEVIGQYVGAKWHKQKQFTNKVFAEQARLKTLENINNLPTNFLPYLLRIWAGLTSGAIRLNEKRQLVVTVLDTRLQEIVEDCAGVVLLDATGHKRSLALHLEIPEDRIAVIAQESPALSNVTVTNINMSGMKSGNWSDQLSERLPKLLAQLEQTYGDLTAIGHKRYAQTIGYNAWWGRDNRGTNAFQGVDNLVMLGTPRPNLGAARDEYRTLTGALDGFDEYYETPIQAEIIQSVGRQRATRFPDRQFNIFTVGTEQDLSYLEDFGMKVHNVEAFDICPEAAAPHQAVKHRILQFIAQLVKLETPDLTQQQVADSLNVSREYVKKLSAEYVGGWQAFKRWVLSLYNSYRSSTKDFQVEDLLEDDNIRDWLKLPPKELVAKVTEVVARHGWQAFECIVGTLPTQEQAYIWSLISPFVVPDRAIEELFGDFVPI